MGLIRRIRRRLKGGDGRPEASLTRRSPITPFQPRAWTEEGAVVSALALSQPAVTRISEGIYSVPILGPEGRRLLLDELDRYNAWAQLSGVWSEANSMHEAAVLCESLGLTPVIDHWVFSILNPIREACFQNEGSEGEGKRNTQSKIREF